MSIVKSSDRDEGRIELENGYSIQVTVWENKTPNTQAILHCPDGSTVDTESQEDGSESEIVDELVLELQQLNAFTDGSNLQQSDSDLLRDLGRQISDV